MDAKTAWDNVSSGLTGVDRWWSLIKEAYSSEERHYHNLAQLERKLTLLHEIGGAADQRSLILALFFQYLEYDPKEGDSAVKNVSQLKTFANETGLDSDTTTKIEMLLTSEESGPDQALLQDLDMAALAVPAPEYAGLVQQVRKEYAFLSDEAYKSLRKKILQSFLLIPNIFSTDAFRERFENQARSNIEGEVASMEQS